MADRIQVFAVEAIGEQGEKEVIAQIHLECDRCEPVVLVIPGHHVRQVRDVLIDLLDQFPYLVDGGRTVRTTTQKFTVDAESAKKASDN
jgi:hypothetical protein